MAPRGQYLILAFLCPRIVKACDVTAGTVMHQLLSTCCCVSGCRFGPWVTRVKTASVLVLTLIWETSVYK